MRSPTWYAFLAEAEALTGDLDDALRLLDEQIVQIERPGWEERLYYAEILRLKGWVLSLRGELEQAEQNFLASLEWARRQQAKMWELRTSTSLARLGRAKADANKRMSCSSRFSAGLLKASTPRICWRRKRFSLNWGRSYGSPHACLAASLRLSGRFAADVLSKLP